MATKAELEAEHQRCEQLRIMVDQAVVERDFATAVQLAASALPHTHASATYQRRYLKVDQPTTPNIDALLQYSPALFLGSMLDSMERWFTDGTRTERNALPVFPDQLAQARTILAIALGMWAKLVAASMASLRPPAEAEYVLRTWIAAGLVIGVPGATSS